MLTRQNPPSTQRIRGICGLCFLALLIASAMSNDVMAACGDYLMVGGASAHGMVDHRNADSRAMLGIGYPQHQESAPRSCHGPNCRRLPAFPAVPQIPLPSVQIERLAIVDHSSLVFTTPSRQFDCWTTCATSSTSIDEIFHPPRI